MVTCLLFKHRDLVLSLNTRHDGALVVPELGRPRQAKFWGILARQPILNDELEANERPCVRKKGIPKNYKLLNKSPNTRHELLIQGCLRGSLVASQR